MKNQFLIVGAPGMGKSTLLAELPRIVLRATCVDLENCKEPDNPEFVRRQASSILSGDWRHPIFLGNAGADACQMAELGMSVIALHCQDRSRYLEQMNARDQKYRQASQGDLHWECHRKLFEEVMPDRNIHPFFLDSVTMSAEETIQAIATNFDLKLWTNQVVWITGPRGAGKTSTAHAYSNHACCVDTDGLLCVLNEIVPSEFRYGEYQSTHGYEKIPSSEFAIYLREAWGRVRKAPRHNCPLVVAGWHVREPWLRSVILNTFAKGHRVAESFHLLCPPIESLVTNIKIRDDALEIEQHCCEAGVEALRQTQTDFDKLCIGWQLHENSHDLLKIIANEIGCPVPAKPSGWL